MTILIFDKNSNSRIRIKAILVKFFPDLHVKETDTVNETLDILSSDRPALMIMDMDVPESILEKVRAGMSKSNLEMLIIGITLFEGIFFPISYFKFGANGYIHKGFREQEFSDAVKKVVSGGKYIDDDLNQLLAKYASDVNVAGSTPFSILNTRELLITQEILKGKTVYQIAGSMNAGKKTVDTSLKYIYSKLGIEYDNVAELIALANKYHEL